MHHNTFPFDTIWTRHPSPRNYFGRMFMYNCPLEICRIFLKALFVSSSRSCHCSILRRVSGGDMAFIADIRFAFSHSCFIPLCHFLHLSSPKIDWFVSHTYHVGKFDKFKVVLKLWEERSPSLWRQMSPKRYKNIQTQPWAVMCFLQRKQAFVRKPSLKGIRYVFTFFYSDRKFIASI